MSWQMVIGLEVHVQLLTQAKLFSSASTSFGQSANHCADWVDLGYPGTLPTVNQHAIAQAIRFGCYVGAEINRASYFERKQYFYPDLPKGYQISQYQSPIVIGGVIPAPTAEDPHHCVRLTRAHLEEDAGKSVHQHGVTLVDLNRAGTPLLEVVTEPCIHSPQAAVSYLKQLHQIVQYLQICDGNLEQGSFRCDVNVSVKREEDTALGTRREIKNLNSFRFVEQAIHYEVEHQIETLSRNETLSQATLLFDEHRQCTVTMRSKEQANDYRYFPCPDLLPVVVSEAMIADIQSKLPEKLTDKALRYHQSYQLAEDTIRTLLQRPKLCQYFEDTITLTQAAPKTIANWLVRDVLSLMSSELPSFDHAQFAELMQLLHQKVIHQSQAKDLLQQLFSQPQSPAAMVKSMNLDESMSTNDIDNIIKAVLDQHPTQVAEYLAGKEKILGFLVGQVMKKTQGKADPAQVNQQIKDTLS